MTALQPGLRKLLTAQIPADFADWLDVVAISALLAFVWQVDTYVFALLAVAMGLPYLIIGPLAGALVDRVDTRRVLIFANLGRGFATIAFFLAGDWPALLALIALRSVVDTFYSPANQSAIQALSDPATRIRANAISHGINQASKIVAPSVGGVLLIWFTPQTVFLANACASFLAVALLLRLSKLPAAPRDADSPGLLASLKSGPALLRDSAVLRAVLLMMAAGYFAMFFYDNLIAPLTRDLGFSQTHLGLLLAAVGAGGVICAAVMSRLGNTPRPFLLITCGALIGGSTVVAVGLAEVTGFPLALATYLLAFFVLGVTTALMVVPIRTVIQNNTDSSSIGQITALSEAANTLALLTAPFIGAWLATATTIGAAFVLGGAVMLGLGLRAFTLRNIS